MFVVVNLFGAAATGCAYQKMMLPDVRRIMLDRHHRKCGEARAMSLNFWQGNPALSCPDSRF
jgi:hypothetical protein